MEAGSFPLDSVADLPNVTVAFPGEHWSNRKAASGAITPGEAVVPYASGQELKMRTAASGDAITQLAIALRPVDHPDAERPAVGPNAIRNEVMAIGDWVHAYYSGVFHLTLVVPDSAYVPGMLIGWDADGVRPTGKSGVGAWAKNAQADIDSFFEVMEWREVNAQNEGILTVRSLRGQF